MNAFVRELTKDEAIEFYNTGKWEPMTPAERGLFQLYQDKLCMPIDKFHEGIETLLERPVWTHEFADPKRLQAEYEGRKGKADFAEIIEMMIDLAGEDKVITLIG